MHFGQGKHAYLREKRENDRFERPEEKNKKKEKNKEKEKKEKNKKKEKKKKKEKRRKAKVGKGHCA